MVDTAAASSVPTGTELCIPAYIVFRRDATGTYTPNTFGNIWDLGRWAFETASPGVATPAVSSPAVPPPAVFEPVLNITAPVTAWNKTADEIKKIADEIFNLPIRGSYNNFEVNIDDKNLIKLTPVEIEVILTLFKEKPALIAEKLFPGLKKEHIQYLNHWGFIETVCPDLSKLETALKSYITIEEALVEKNEFLFVVKRLNTYLMEGLHHVSWESSMSLLKFEDIGTWSFETAPIILEECLRSWLTSEKPSDLIRNFFIQTHLVQNYRRYISVEGRYVNGITEVSSTDFLKGLIDTMNNESSGGVPSVFTKWVAKGVSYTHCKNALAQMGIEQVRKASGQFYKNISPDSVDKCKELGYQLSIDLSYYFRKFDTGGMLDSVMDDRLNSFEAPPQQTENTNPLLTSDFNKMIKDGLIIDIDSCPTGELIRPVNPLDIYKKLLTSLDKENLEVDTKKRNPSATPPSSKETPLAPTNHVELNADIAEKKSTYETRIVGRFLPKPSSTPLESVWTQTSETQITLVE